MSEPHEPSDDELAALIKPLWVATEPSADAQAIRARISTAVDDVRYPQRVLDYVPDYVWDLLDIAAQRGINLGAARIDHGDHLKS